MTMTTDPMRRDRKKWVEIDKGCVVNGKNARKGEQLQLRSVDANYLVNFKKAHHIAGPTQTESRGRGRPPKDAA